MGVFVTNSVARLKCLKKGKVNYTYICFKELDTENQKLLDNFSYDKIDTRGYSESFKEEFALAYIDLLGHIGAKTNSLYWWASFTASKNRFMSKLLPTLLDYYTVCNTIKNNPARSIVLISPPGQITRTLKHYCSQSLIEFKNLDYSNDYCIKIKGGITHFLKMMSFIFKNLLKVFLVRRLFGGHLDNNNEKEKYYVLNTGIYPSSVSNGNKYTDSFFGKLPDFLISKRNKLLIIARIIGDYGNIIKKLSKYKQHLIVPQELFLNYFDVFKVTIDVYLNRVKFDKSIEFYGLDVSKIIQMELDSDYTNTIRAELLQKYIIRNMLDYVNIHTFTTTYENNPWEKICFLSLKEYSPSTKTIGYQHAVVTKASANMFISKEEMSYMPMPDKIVTVGGITEGVLRKYGCYPENLIHSSCALRHEYIYRLKKKNFTKNNTILVALEGVYECYKLVNFVFNALSDNKDYRVIIRTHPERPFSKIRNDLCFDIDSHANFSVSNQKPLKDDLSENDILIYWGSTVSLEALMMGIPVIHVSLDDIVNVDPLADCSHLKWTISNVEELPNAITDVYDMPEHDFLSQYNKARSYIERYLKKVTDDRLSEFIVS